ncbi:MAG: response regulator transcription factor [candidate division NC10 bacterium]|nr:response regulator transcription factor [candidate division NC10 bacterium]
MVKIRVLLADDHAVLRSGLRLLLNAQPDIEVVGEAANGAEAMAKARALLPDVILMDLTMPGIGGLEATGRIKSENPGVRVLVLTMHDDPSYLRQLLQAGASGYVLKKSADADVLSAIRAAYRGEVFLDSSLVGTLVDEVIRPVRCARPRDSFETLSDREREVLKWVARGYTNQEIAEKLFLSVKTIETYRARLAEKLGLRGRAELVRFAIERGLLQQTD